MLLALLTTAQILATMPLQANGAALGMIAYERRRDGMTGSVTLDLTIAADGALARCDVVDQRGAGHLDRLICDGFRRDRFIPARDGQGTVIPAFTRYVYEASPKYTVGPSMALAALLLPIKANFAIPVDHLPATATKPAVGALAVTDPDGKVADCIVQITSGNLTLDRLACTTMATTDLPPVRDGDGRSIRAIRQLAIGFVVTPAAAVRP